MTRPFRSASQSVEVVDRTIDAAAENFTASNGIVALTELVKSH